MEIVSVIVGILIGGVVGILVGANNNKKVKAIANKAKQDAEAALIRAKHAEEQLKTAIKKKTAKK